MVDVITWHVKDATISGAGYVEDDTTNFIIVGWTLLGVQDLYFLKIGVDASYCLLPLSI